MAYSGCTPSSSKNWVVSISPMTSIRIHWVDGDPHYQADHKEKKKSTLKFKRAFTSIKTDSEELHSGPNQIVHYVLLFQPIKPTQPKVFEPLREF